MTHTQQSHDRHPGRQRTAAWQGTARLAVAALVALAFLLADGLQPAWGASFKLVAHPRVATDSLLAADGSRIFLKKTAKWPDGSTVVPVDLPVASRVREAFSQAVHGKSASAVDAYWQKQIFTGRDLPPLTKATEAEVLAFVRSTPGALGYVSSETASEGVKVIELK
jgi:ABC-type phosphate transport system substrate-binding protein